MQQRVPTVPLSLAPSFESEHGSVEGASDEPTGANELTVSFDLQYGLSSRAEAAKLETLEEQRCVARRTCYDTPRGANVYPSAQKRARPAAPGAFGPRSVRRRMVFSPTPALGLRDWTGSAGVRPSRLRPFPAERRELLPRREMRAAAPVAAAPVAR